MEHKKIVFWSTTILDLIEGKAIGGIAVQLFFWSKVFVEQNWEVYSFTDCHKDTLVKEDITFLPKRNIKRINLLAEWWYAFHYISKLKPDVIIYRGANRELLPLVRISNLLGAKLLFFSASDVNFEPGKELIGGNANRRLYQDAVRQCRYFIVQNKHQQDTLQKNYGKESLQQYNIWGRTGFSEQEQPPQSDVVWIANFRRLKRAEWVLDMAERIPRMKFVLAGGPSGDGVYYKEMKVRAANLANVDFLGGRSFFYANELVAKSKVLLCTSTFEGFPNTFLQAWSNGLPVISTVDPSGIIEANGLGEVVKDEEELTAALMHIVDDKQYYQQLQQNVNAFFKANHSSEAGYKRVIQYIQGCDLHRTRKL